MAVAIVAIPADDDDVWLVSSEKVPHMTLLFLGEQADNEKIGEMAEFLKHTSHMAMTKFGLTVDHRGELGPDKADVLFFADHASDPEFKMVAQAREFLLENPAIKAAYNSVEQYDGWTPHLTMGYPEMPAKPDTREYKRFSWVRFDRVALWVGDFSGPEFRLQDQWTGEVRMSDEIETAGADAAEAILAHHGVKGMKWGVRKEETIARLRRVESGTASTSDRHKTFWGVGTKGLGGAHGIQPKNAGKRANRMEARVVKKKDKQYDESLRGVKGFIKVNNAIAEKINPRLDVMNANPKYEVNMLLPQNASVHKAYLNEYRSNLQKSLDEVAADIGMNASGTKKLTLHMVGDGLDTTWEARLDTVGHAADGEVYLKITPKFNDKGQITSTDFHVVTPEQALAHADTTFSDKPWSNFDKANYSVEQWHHACLIHDHEGAPESKSVCKMPVREPNGTFNKNGIHAAASALAGGRGGVDATDDQKAQAARSLSRLYSSMDEELPESVVALLHSDLDDDILAHYGVKGMKWGIRKERSGEVTVGTNKKGRLKAEGGYGHEPTEQAKRTVGTVQKGKASGTHALSNEELQAAITRMNLEQNYARLVDQTQPKSLGKKFVQMLMNDGTNIGRQQINRAAGLAATQKVNIALEKNGIETSKKKQKKQDA